ncbi:hypothetical protein [Stenotrophomonas sp.]|uniref:hypothetical protein n=1 Tax=Stenotrophomonas sp. TaxID=69392 RepID=UPI0028ADA2E4|nr:hypothetical protein [Stenotrophomonas sp.]
MENNTNHSKKLKDANGPRFNFGHGQDARDNSATATIKELLQELNEERTDDSGNLYDSKSIRTACRLLTSITGKAYRSTTEKHSVSTIKTIKLLFVKSRDIDAHLIKLIEAPKGNTFGTMNFLTMPSSPDAESVKQQIKNIIDELSKEIDQTELDKIQAIQDPQQPRKRYRKETNEAIADILLTHILIDHNLMKDADDYLTERTLGFLRGLASPAHPTPAHVATYLHLSILDDLHLLHFELTTQLSIPNDRLISNTPVSFEKICREASSEMGTDIQKDTNFLSIHGMREFCIRHMNDLVDTIKRATRLSYTTSAFENDLPRACMLMHLYLDEAELATTEDSKPIGIVHIVAAFASVLHQRFMKAETKLVKTSVRYGPKTDPQRHLDLRISRATLYIPWTVQYLYGERMKWYILALLARKSAADSHVNFQLAQSELTKHIFMSLSPDHIIKTTEAYREYMIKSTNEFIRVKDLQETRFRKIINY